MPSESGLRDIKKAHTRQMISNTATRLFVEHGFEQVSMDDIAREAAVSRKTVFNYFPRKEDLVFDREDEVRALAAEALAARGARSPLRAIQAWIRALVGQRHPLFLMSERPVRFWRTVADSPALTTRARELQVILGDDLARLLAEAVGRAPPDPEARLAAGILMDTLVVAYGEALQAFRDRRDPDAAFNGVLARGFVGVDAALAGTPYA
jgi:AcrR family transcriptional regulator